jgi:hypothetical protein
MKEDYKPLEEGTSQYSFGAPKSDRPMDMESGRK